MLFRRHDTHRAEDDQPAPDQSEFTVGHLTTHLRSRGIPFEDERVYDAEGTLLPPAAGTWIEHTAGLLRGAAEAAVAALAGPRIEDIDLVEAAGQQASSDALVRDVPERRATLSKDISQAKNELAEIEAVADRALPEKRANWNTPGKLVMIAADTAVLATPLYLTGSPLVLAMIYSVGIAVASVVAGAYVGGQVGLTLDRHRRGPLPDDAPLSVAHLYAPHGARFDASLVGLLVFAGVISLALAGAVTLKLAGGGDPLLYALGAAIPAAVTPWGSAALQAWSSNAAHETYLDVSQKLAELEARDDELCQLQAAAASHAARLAELRSIVGHNVAASGRFTEAEADIRPTQPRIFGYDRLPDTAGSTASLPRWPQRGGGLRRWVDLLDFVDQTRRQPSTPAAATTAARNGHASEPPTP
ncbi:hypothetical protein [Egicoccus sp. AB-alg2]|uniref:hypothetical protein n=1 Tax=Egicoccus sp. AB-alg2 TaxID=3242693 RepID=UPI00359E5350